MRVMSFRSYIAARRVTPTPAGDFTAHAKAKADLPDFTTWQEVEAYVLGQNLRRGALDAARAVWRGYRVHMRGRNNA